MNHTLKPDAQGHVIFDNKSGTVKPGDSIFITGNPKSVLFSNLQGTTAARINITNVVGEKLVVGNPLWTGGGYSYGIMFKRCNHFNLFGSDKSSFLIMGSNVANIDRGAYFNIRIDDLSDNATVRTLSVRNGGNAIWCKTEVNANDPRTWSENNVLENFIFEDLDIRDTYTEGLYIGHTATWWDLNKKVPYNPASLNDRTVLDNPAVYKQPVKLKNVTIRNCYLEGCGLDGIQTAAIDGLQLYNNEVKNWGTRNDSVHSGGILIGGRVKGFRVYDNHVHDGWGNMMQIFAEGGGEAVVKNNLLVNTAFGEGVMMKGTNDLVVSFTNNTVIGTFGARVVGGHSPILRINGYYGQKSPQIIQDNILCGTEFTNQWVPNRAYIYEENDGKAAESNNIKFKTVEEAKLDAASFYQPLPGSPSAGIGFRKAIPEPPKPTKIKIAGVSVGKYQFELYDDGTSTSKVI